MPDKYMLTMNEEQADITIKALDLYTRLRIGQWEELAELCIYFEPKNIDDYCEKRDTAREILLAARRVVMPELTRGASFGVYKFPETERAFNVLKAVRSARAWHNNPQGGWTVDFDRPRAINVAEEMPACEVVNDAGQKTGDTGTD